MYSADIANPSWDIDLSPTKKGHIDSIKPENAENTSKIIYNGVVEFRRLPGYRRRGL